MGVARFEKNARVKLEEGEFVFRRKVSDTCWQLESPTNGRMIERELDELLRLYANGGIRFMIEGDDRPGNKADIEPPTKQKEMISVHLKYVRAVESLPVSQSVYERAISDVWTHLNRTVDFGELPVKKPHWVTVYRWKTRYKRFGDDTRALLHRQRNRVLKHPSELLHVCEEAIDTIYLTRERKTLQDTLDHAAEKVRQANEIRRERKLSLLYKPTRRLLRKLLDRIPAYDRYAARYGEQAARVKFRSMKGHRMTSAPLERVEIDHTPLDLFVVDDNQSLPLGRPYITLCIDDFSRCVLAVIISFVPPSYLTVAMTLKQAFVPKTWLKAEYPHVENDWPVFGVMTILVVDQALEFHSAALEQACFRLGIEIHYSPRKTPWFKGKIERVLQSLNRGVAHGTRGTTFSNIFEKGDYDPEKSAVVRLSTLKTAVHIWICDVYHQRKHRALGIPPGEMWAKSIKPEEIRLPEDPEALDAIMGRPYFRVLTHKGIEFEGLLYNSDALMELRYRHGAKLHVEIRVDESNIGFLYILYKNEFLRATALHNNYADGISLWQHKLFQAHAPAHDPDGWLKGKERIRQMFQDEFRFMRRRPRRGVGRALEGGGLTKSRTDKMALPAPSITNLIVASLDSAMPASSECSSDRPHYKAIVQVRSGND